jgi:hypothetical protein
MKYGYVMTGPAKFRAVGKPELIVRPKRVRAIWLGWRCLLDRTRLNGMGREKLAAVSGRMA